MGDVDGGLAATWAWFSGLASRDGGKPDLPGNQILSQTLSNAGDHIRMAQAKILAAELDERRRSDRAEANELAFISVAGSSTRCRVINLSDDGAAIDVPDAAHIPSRFQLMMESDRSVRNCRIAWIKQNKIGVEFEQTIDNEFPVTHRDRQFMQYLRDKEWRRATNLPDSAKLIMKLLANGWIERSSSGAGLAYRITPKGLIAKQAPIKLK